MAMLLLQLSIAEFRTGIKAIGFHVLFPACVPRGELTLHLCKPVPSMMPGSVWLEIRVMRRGHVGATFYFGCLRLLCSIQYKPMCARLKHCFHPVANFIIVFYSVSVSYLSHPYLLSSDISFYFIGSSFSFS